MRCDKCGQYRPKYAVCEFDDTLTEPYESCLNWKPITNADHIRAMTDEELADWMYGVITNALNILQIGSDAPTQSYFGWLDWLKQEVKG